MRTVLTLKCDERELLSFYKLHVEIITIYSKIVRRELNNGYTLTENMSLSVKKFMLNVGL